MAICWYCHWGWSKPVADIYLEAVKRLDGDESPLLFGPAHVVWEDENFDSAECCLETFGKYIGDWADGELEVVRWSLNELAKLPMELRCPEPDDYDNEHPELFPPSVEVVKIY